MIRNGICERVKATRGGGLFHYFDGKASSYTTVKSSSEEGALNMVAEVMDRIEGLVDDSFDADIDFDDDDQEFEFMSSLIDAEFVSGPVHAKPGSAMKVAVLAKRYESGIPLWNDDDSKIAIEYTGKNRGGNPS